MPDDTTPIFGLTEPTVGADSGTWGGIDNTNKVNLDTYLGVLRQAAKAVTVAATTTLDFSAPASVFSFTLSQATTLAIANTPANITTQQLSTQFTLIITNGGAFVITWPASFTWSGGSAPNLQVAGTDVIVGWSPNNGTNWYVGVLSAPGKTTLTKVGQLGQVSTTSTSEVSLGTLTLAAGKLATNGDILRVTVSGRFVVTFPADTATVKFKFGAATLTFQLTAQTQTTYPFTLTVTVTRLSATTQQLTGTLVFGTGSGTNANVLSSFAAGSETLANAVTLDFRGLVSTNNDTLYLDASLVEAATQ